MKIRQTPERTTVYWLLRLMVCLMLPLTVGMAGAVITAGGVDSWYPNLVKPPFSPPQWLFGPAWTILYLSMGIALFLVVRSGEAKNKIYPAVGIFLLQLVVNFFWSLIFFGWHRPGLAFAEILLLWLAILWTIRLFRPVSPQAAWLLLPYLVWVSFAAVLNYSLWRLNP